VPLNWNFPAILGPRNRKQVNYLNELGVAEPPTRNEPVGPEIVEGSEASKNSASQKPTILTEPEHRTSDSDAEKDSRHRMHQQQRLSLPLRTPFPDR
jgi:hypothetical protein